MLRPHVIPHCRGTKFCAQNPPFSKGGIGGLSPCHCEPKRSNLPALRSVVTPVTTSHPSPQEWRRYRIASSSAQGGLLAMTSDSNLPNPLCPVSGVHSIYIIGVDLYIRMDYIWRGQPIRSFTTWHYWVQVSAIDGKILGYSRQMEPEDE